MAKKAESRLPTLPDGYFWRVGKKEGYSSSWADGFSGYGVSLRRGRKVIGRSPVMEEVSDFRIVNAAEEVYLGWQRAIYQAAERARLAGDYPPKTL